MFPSRQQRRASSPGAVGGRSSSPRLPVAPVVWLAVWLAVSVPRCAAASEAAPQLVVGDFSKASLSTVLPEGWRQLTFRGQERTTRYRLVSVNGRVALKAESDRSASGLIRKIRIDLRQYPLLRWRWKVDGIIEAGDGYRKEGDDFAARIYLTFPYDPQKSGFWEKMKYESARLFYGEYPPRCALCYVRGNHEPLGAVIPNPFSPQTVMIVVETGPFKAGRWVDITRNAYEDYRKVFGDGPPVASGVAVMTDSDNTGESATAYYGDIVFSAYPDPTVPGSPRQEGTTQALP